MNSKENAHFWNINFLRGQHLPFKNETLMESGNLVMTSGYAQLKPYTVRWKLGSVKSPVTPGVTGEHRRCAPANGACNTGCYRGTSIRRRQSHRELQADQSEATKSVATNQNSRCDWRTSPVRTGDVAPIPTFHRLYNKTSHLSILLGQFYTFFKYPENLGAMLL